MTEIKPGIWTYTISGLTAGARQEFKITDGTWDWNHPGPNSWYYAGQDGSVTVTFNQNFVDDGWLPAQHRLGLSTDPGSWAIAGDFNEWNNAAPGWEMTHLRNGIYVLNAFFSTGNYEFKPVYTGTWDSISEDARSTNTANMSVEITEEDELVDIYVDAFAGVVGIGMDVTVLPHDPLPQRREQEVPVAGLELSWAVAEVPSAADPNVLVVDPNLVSHKLYMSDGSWTDPNVYLVDEVVGWDAETSRAAYTPDPALETDARYFWRVDMVLDDGTEITGCLWTFTTEWTKPIITEQPMYQIIDAGQTAVFSVSVSSETPETTYQWYKVDDEGADIQLVDGGTVSGAQTASLSIANAGLGDEGYYYCIIDNESGIPAISQAAPLGIKRLLAHWDFEDAAYQSTVPGSPASFFYGSPTFTDGLIGDGMSFSDENGGDLLYTDPNEASYFDICNYEMTVALWIKSEFAATWGPMVARDGEDGMGWQLRHHGETLDRICFTTRGTGYNEDGRPSDRTVYDGDWHYVVGVFDGKNGLKAVYINGVVSRLYSSDDGTIAADTEPAVGVINATAAPVSLAGRVRVQDGDLVIEDWSITPGVLDEVKIYNYALDAETIAQNFADMTGNAVCPVPLAYDLDGNCVINLADLALLASEWLTDARVQPAP